MRRPLLGLAGLSVLLSVFAWGVLARAVYAPAPSAAPRVQIPRGAGLTQVVEILYQAGLAPWKAGARWGFLVWGHPKRVKAGIYAFKKGARLVDVFDDLEHGRVDLVTVTLPEGLTAREMAAILEAADVTAAERFVALARDPTSPPRWRLPGPSLEGFLFPDTYRFARELPAGVVVDALIRRFRKASAVLAVEAARQGLDLHAWVTLASVVEKETGVEGEKPLIAAVFRNRLAAGMRLQTDPTVIYGIENFDGNLRRSDLERDTPYNTYTRAGLPAGPIANPGRSTLEAVLRPAEVPYLYFVSRNDGTHVFSTTYSEHLRAVNLYQRGGRRRT
ncbi:MAG: endolytic transglycosylase MltG [Deltaproteobacteria bacterium]|nr:endolytic transglycosylase MltG [Deltaproteobacteria bacterium]